MAGHLNMVRLLNVRSDPSNGPSAIMRCSSSPRTPIRAPLLSSIEQDRAFHQANALALRRLDLTFTRRPALRRFNEGGRHKGGLWSGSHQRSGPTPIVTPGRSYPRS